MNESPISPRISALQQELEAGNRGVIEAFWREVTALGTPLVEDTKDTNGNTQALITFLWSARGEMTNVVVFGGFRFYWDFLHNQMTRLLDTSIWYKTERVRTDVRAWYRLSPNDSLEPSHDWAARTASFLPDPLNGRRYIVAGDAENPFTPRDEAWSVIELPATPPQKWVIQQPGVPAGQVDKHYIHSEILGNDRPIWVYTPPTYATGGEPYALLVLFDGFIYAYVIPTPTILDNLHAAGHIPPVVAVMVNNPGLDARLRELACHPPFVDFLTDELLPWVREKYNVTKDPAQTIVGGSSLGGLLLARHVVRRLARPTWIG